VRGVECRFFERGRDECGGCDHGCNLS
jgi:hypothetical protein